MFYWRGLFAIDVEGIITVLYELTLSATIILSYNSSYNCLPQWRGETRVETELRGKNAVRASAVENWSTAPLRIPSAMGAFFHIQYLRLLSAVENLGSLRY